MLSKHDLEAFDYYEEVQEDMTLVPPDYEKDMFTTNATYPDLVADWVKTFEQGYDADLYANLMGEEWDEWEEAFDTDDAKEFKEVLDLVWVSLGYCLSMGWDFDEGFRRLYESNMSKLGPDGRPIFREDGKILKGPSYREPDLEDLV